MALIGAVAGDRPGRKAGYEWGTASVAHRSRVRLAATLAIVAGTLAFAYGLGEREEVAAAFVVVGLAQVLSGAALLAGLRVGRLAAIALAAVAALLALSQIDPAPVFAVAGLGLNVGIVLALAAGWRAAPDPGGHGEEDGHTDPSGWWMHHGDERHTGFVADSPINTSTVRDLSLKHELHLDGPVLSTPAVVDGHVYVGTANSREAIGQNGGSVFKVGLEDGKIRATFHWDIPSGERDTHGFCGMGCTPVVRDGRVWFSAFNGKVYCLDQRDLALIWVTDLRYSDPLHGQPVTNDLGVDAGLAPAAGWSSPVVVNGKLYVGIGEGENPLLYAFVYCLDAATGDVEWIFCTCQYEEGRHNRPNELPAETLAGGKAPDGYTVFHGQPLVKGSSVWGSIAYDPEHDVVYCPTGNPVPDSALPSKGYSNGLLALDARTGEFRGFRQFPAASSYRPSDIDVDVGGSPTVFQHDGRWLVGLACKNGAYMTMRAPDLEVVDCRQLLPKMRDGSRIPTVDPHVPPSAGNEMNPVVPNQVSDANEAENYSGSYSTGAWHADSGTMFVGLGGNNYHPLAPGIDTPTTPFLRALHADGLHDAWDVEGDPPRYVNGRPPFYTYPKESGLALPAIANDVVFMTTSRLALYAFRADDGRLLWQDLLGDETGGFNGGYGYCLGPAVYQEYVVTGSLILGRMAGTLRIYALNGGASG